MSTSANAITASCRSTAMSERGPPLPGVHVGKTVGPDEAVGAGEVVGPDEKSAPHRQPEQSQPNEASMRGHASDGETASSVTFMKKRWIISSHEYGP